MQKTYKVPRRLKNNFETLLTKDILNTVSAIKIVQ